MSCFLGAQVDVRSWELSREAASWQDLGCHLATLGGTRLRAAAQGRGANARLLVSGRGLAPSLASAPGCPHGRFSQPPVSASHPWSPPPRAAWSCGPCDASTWGALGAQALSPGSPSSSREALQGQLLGKPGRRGRDVVSRRLCGLREEEN